MSSFSGAALRSRSTAQRSVRRNNTMRSRVVLLLILSAGLTAADARAQARIELVPSVSFSTAYDDNIFTTQEGAGDAMMHVSPAFEAFYESPKASLRGLY